MESAVLRSYCNRGGKLRYVLFSYVRQIYFLRFHTILLYLSKYPYQVTTQCITQCIVLSFTCNVCHYQVYQQVYCLSLQCIFDIFLQCLSLLGVLGILLVILVLSFDICLHCLSSLVLLGVMFITLGYCYVIYLYCFATARCTVGH